MASYTEKYNLKKPAPEDAYNIQDFNDNMDLIEGGILGAIEKINENYPTDSYLAFIANVSELSILGALKPVKFPVTTGTTYGLGKQILNYIDMHTGITLTTQERLLLSLGDDIYSTIFFGGKVLEDKNFWSLITQPEFLTFVRTRIFCTVEQWIQKINIFTGLNLTTIEEVKLSETAMNAVMNDYGLAQAHITNSTIEDAFFGSGRMQFWQGSTNKVFTIPEDCDIVNYVLVSNGSSASQGKILSGSIKLNGIKTISGSVGTTTALTVGATILSTDTGELINKLNCSVFPPGQDGEEGYYTTTTIRAGNQGAGGGGGGAGYGAMAGNGRTKGNAGVGFGYGGGGGGGGASYYGSDAPWGGNGGNGGGTVYVLPNKGHAGGVRGVGVVQSAGTPANNTGAEFTDKPTRVQNINNISASLISSFSKTKSKLENAARSNSILGGAGGSSGFAGSMANAYYQRFVGGNGSAGESSAAGGIGVNANGAYSAGTGAPGVIFIFY